MQIDLGLCEAKKMLRWKVVVKAEPIFLNITLARSDGKPSPNLVVRLHLVLVLLFCGWERCERRGIPVVH